MLTYITTLISFLAIDAIWLGIIAKNLYRQQIGHLMTDNIVWSAAIIFYLIFVGGLVFFVINPHLRGDTALTQTLIKAALFGFITYATYDLTNMATLKDWPLFVTIVDLIWGATLSTLTTFITLQALSKL